MSSDTARWRVSHFDEWRMDQYQVVGIVLWGFALVFYGVGDTGLTIVVQQLGGFEANPVARAFLRTAGYAGLVVQKALVVALLGVCWRYYPTVGGFSRDPWRLIVPAIAAGRGIHLVGIHAHNIGILL